MENCNTWQLCVDAYVPVPDHTVNHNVDEIIGDHKLGFIHFRWTIDQIFCILDILEKNGTIMAYYIDCL